MSQQELKKTNFGPLFVKLWTTTSVEHIPESGRPWSSQSADNISAVTISWHATHQGLK